MKTLHLSEHGTCKLPEGFDALGDLKETLQAAWESRWDAPWVQQAYWRKAGDTETLTDEETDEESSEPQRYLELKADRELATKNYVGCIQSDGLQINIWPKIFDNDYAQGGDPANAAEMLALLSEWIITSNFLNFGELDKSILEHDWTENIGELLIFLFSTYAREIVEHTPYQSYHPVVEEMETVRGSIAFPEYIRDNLSTGRWHKITCEHEPFTLDNLLNRIIKHTCGILSNCTRHTASLANLEAIELFFDEVSDVRVQASDCDRVHLNRMFEEYESILNHCRWFLSSVDPGGQGSASTFTFLIRTELLYEAYLGALLDQCSLGSVDAQPKEELARSASKVFRIRPDFVIKDQSGEKLSIVADAKYKLWKDNGATKPSFSAGDMYQMITYCTRLGINQGFLIHPKRIRSSGSRSRSVKEEQKETYTLTELKLNTAETISIHAVWVDFSNKDSAIKALRSLNFDSPAEKSVPPSPLGETG